MGAKSTTVTKLPNCDLCSTAGITEPARYDAKTKAGWWAYVCTRHFKEHGCKTGLGLGQELVVRGE